MAETQTQESIRLLRQDLAEHRSEDKRDFEAVKDAVHHLDVIVARYVGGITLAAWALGVGIPAILAAMLTYMVKHW